MRDENKNGFLFVEGELFKIMIINIEEKRV